MPERISVKRASELLGISQLSVRGCIDEGIINIGFAIHTSKHRTNYHVCPQKLADYLGVSVEKVKGDLSI